MEQNLRKFTMKPGGIFIFGGVVLIAMGIFGFPIGMLTVNLAYEMIEPAAWVFGALAILSGLIGIYFLLFPFMEKIVVEDDLVTYHYHFVKKYQFDIKEIERLKYSRFSEEYKCYDWNGELVLQFSKYWSGYSLMKKRLHDIGKFL